ncbi:MAG: hypothetical protein Lokiarch_06470 [Candidatus Lokiarchaeum sp. GC14_75]|nr:MAG: hypothetical protein Lokiarch_06470 [Candidatus Lokiarchaeum sp. GC14_75]HEC39744.1 hypothetical protein [bacterium]
MMKFRFIAMLDILGFKNLLKQKGIEAIHQLMRDLFRSAREGTNRDHTMTVNGRTYRNPSVRLNYFIFSDTILVWKDYEESNGKEKEIKGNCNLFREFNHGISMLLERALLKKIPLRGAIAFGKTIIQIDEEGQNHEIIGQPIVDSYLVGEAQDWVGIAFHSSCLPFIEQKCDPTVKKYPVPYNKEKLKLLDNGKETDYSLEWGGNVKKVLNEFLENLRSEDVSEKILNKYINAVDYCKDHEVFL